MIPQLPLKTASIIDVYYRTPGRRGIFSTVRRILISLSILETNHNSCRISLIFGTNE